MTTEIKITFARLVERIGHPLFLAGALALWWAMGRSEGATLVALVGALVAMEILERLIPANPDWRQTGAEKAKLIGVYVLFIVAFGLVLASYEAWLVPLLADVREALGVTLWPSAWPILAQVLLLYFASDIIYYWIHRGIHNSSFLWRASGHGFHHAFHNLHAINVGANHPFEVLLIVLPTVILGALFGAPAEAASGAAALATVNATLAHSNLRLDTPGFNWFFTSSNQHRRHHSVVFEDSNTNYACNAILWDRLFGTYSAGAVEQTGIGPRQPSFGRLFLLPFREPADVDTVATRGRVQRNS